MGLICSRQTMKNTDRVSGALYNPISATVRRSRRLGELIQMCSSGRIRGERWRRPKGVGIILLVLGYCPQGSWNLRRPPSDVFGGQRLFMRSSTEMKKRPPGGPFIGRGGKGKGWGALPLRVLHKGGLCDSVLTGEN